MALPTMAVAFCQMSIKRIQKGKTKMAEIDRIHVSEDSHIPRSTRTTKVEEAPGPAGKFHFVTSRKTEGTKSG